jgi:hypothetical protein
MKSSILIGALATVLIAQPSLAQSSSDDSPTASMEEDVINASERGHKRGPHGDRGRHGGRHGRGAIDINADGVIGDDEASFMAERFFLQIDRDKSGDLSEAEFTAVPRGRGWWRMFGAQDEAVTDALKTKFIALDTNKDQKVAKAEFLADAQARFLAADANKDGKVTPWEFRSQN